ncbi:MAG: hypothetical protein IKZ35_01305 [Clostridia bacterium]|nr:hypothetical protein [Clostridia bacterium]
MRLYKYQRNKRKECIIRVRLDKEMVEAVKCITKNKGCSLSSFIRKAIIFMIAKES